ncbi:MAG TPA: hypothetical protein VKZ79_00010 [Alphaproteobacteria bacterium]|nr:hypothetical protein [Alphaproteobacteria bacterium]
MTATREIGEVHSEREDIIWQLVPLVDGDLLILARVRGRVAVICKIERCREQRVDLVLVKLLDDIGQEAIDLKHHLSGLNVVVEGDLDVGGAAFGGLFEEGDQSTAKSVGVVELPHCRLAVEFADRAEVRDFRILEIHRRAQTSGLGPQGKNSRVVKRSLVNAERPIRQDNDVPTDLLRDITERSAGRGQNISTVRRTRLRYGGH